MHLICSCLGLSVASAATSPVDAVRDSIGEWANTEKAISREALKWQSDKILMQDMIAVAEQRVSNLETLVSEGANQASAADNERMELLDRSEQIADKATRIEAQILWLETTLRDFKPRLPEVLQDELEVTYQRIPETKSDTATASMGERMQTVINLISKIRQFDSTITLSESIRTLPGTQTEAAFRTMWLGLGQAYYIAPNDAGYGLATQTGWEWHSQPELAKEIATCMELLEGTKSTPEVISLPVTLTKGGAQ